jgi:SAM-dependent methyltransferase
MLLTPTWRISFMTSQPGLVFGVDAAHYHVSRPAVPAEVADWLVPSGCDLAVDVGAGTGHFTRILLTRAARVVATDPDPQMCAWLREQYPDAAVHEGSAESIPVESGTADGVFSSNAWHWFDPRAAGLEAARCLKPGGVLGVSWHDRGQSDLWLNDVQEVILSAHIPGRRIHELNLPEDLPFTPVEKNVTSYTRQMTPAEICAMFSTYSAVISLSDPEREDLLGRFLVHLQARAQEQGVQTHPIPFVSTLYRARRK